jgi:hypothetical protein
MGRDSDSSQIKAVGVPAGLDRHVRMRPFMSVSLTGSLQQNESLILQIKHLTPNVRSKLSST